MITAVSANTERVGGIRERDSGNTILRARKILSGGTFAYNAAQFRTYVVSRICTSLAGVANTNLLFMGAANEITAIHFFRHGYGVRMLQAWVNLRFSWTGRLANGNSKASRRMFLTADGTAVATLTTLTTSNMYDIRDTNATDVAVDDAANGVSRALPGELVFMIDHAVNALSTSGNHFDYKRITGM